MQAEIWSRRQWLALAAASLAVPAQASLPELIARARASIVAVGTFNATDSPRFAFRGTGFVVGDGTTVVTNFHVLPTAAPDAGDAPLMVQVLKGPRALEPRVARVLVTDRAHDLALLRLEGEPVPSLALDEADLVAEGLAVALIGFPIGGVFGYSPVTHRGIISAVTRIALPAPTAQQLSARALAQIREGAFEIYQLDATAYPGNSGGPVFDVASGKVVGVVNMVLVRGTRESALSNPTGISYAIPVRHTRDMLARS